MRSADCETRRFQGLAPLWMDRPGRCIANGETEKPDIAAGDEMQAARSARAVTGFFRPAPPVASVAGTIEDACAFDHEIVCADGMDRRGETGIR
ncbi:hypothetical protein D3C80_1752990 [compost metagenome]